MDGEQFRFRFKEENDARTPHRPTPEERQEIAAHPHFHSVLGLIRFGGQLDYAAFLSVNIASYSAGLT